MPPLPHRPLGRSGLAVSQVSLGSWRTYERIPREQGLAVMSSAREAGVDFLDDARYNDEIGTAPLPTGYSEVVFGELFRGAGWRRDDVVVANKLWWEFWPRQSAAEELETSLDRMGFDHIDLIYAEQPPPGLDVAQIVGDCAGLITAGKARAWGVLNWPAALIVEAAEVAREQGMPPPCAAQLAYNLVQRSPVEDPQTMAALERAGAAVVASSVLASGTLSGKYSEAAATGRIAGAIDDPRHRTSLSAAERLRELAREVGASPAALAIAFTLANPAVATALVGATRPEQVADNVSAVALLERVTDTELATLRAVGADTS